MWLDREKLMLYDKEHSQNGIGFDVAGKDEGIYIFSQHLIKDEKRQLTDYLKYGRKHEASENLNISDVSVQSKHSVGDNVRTKKNIDNLLETHRQYLINDNTGIEKYLGKDCKIVYVYYDEKYKYHRYLIDIDNGDYWWVDECFD